MIARELPPAPTCLADVAGWSDADLCIEGTMRLSAAAKFSGMADRTLRDAMHHGSLPYTRHPKTRVLLIPTLALRLWLAEGMIRRDLVCNERIRP